MFSSKTDDWATPQDFFDKLDLEFQFTLDPCADLHNHKCARYYNREQDGLIHDWGGERVFCNPPYGKEIAKWVQKSFEESRKKNTLVVMLIPARTDTKYFHDFIYGKAEIRFIRGRLKFGNAKTAAPFPSMVVIFRNEEDIKTGKFVYGTDYRYFPRHQRTSRTQMRTYNCLNHARADFISCGCGNDYRIVCLKSVEVERVIEFDSPDGYELQNGDWGSDDE